MSIHRKHVPPPIVLVSAPSSPTFDRDTNKTAVFEQQQQQQQRRAAKSAVLAGYYASLNSSAASTPVRASAGFFFGDEEQQANAAGGFRSPKRHHSRPPPGAKPEVKETLDARLEHIDGESYVINQYIVKEQVGRGSYGAVCRAVHSVTGETFAIKEFSKSRLRKQSLSAMLRHRHPGPSRSPGFPPLRMREFPPQKSSLPSSSGAHQSDNPLDLIRHEIAALKKLNHENVVNLIEVLDNPAGDSLYMVLEWCSRGVVMNVSETATAQPYEEEQCRLYFRDLILGIEYLHSQGIVHRDIKPDNLLLNEDNVLKIVDFGVSEFFAREQENGDTVTKQAGSPAFMAPEMCVVPRIEYSGRASDIWAMGVTLYCLVFGRLPFVGTDGNLLDLYRKTQTEDFYLPENTNADLRDLFERLLDKNFRTRIRMPGLREHPWITLRGEDPLLSYEENTASAVTDVTEQELERAIKGVRGVFDVVRAVNRRSKGVGRRTQSSHRSSSSNRNSVCSVASVEGEEEEEEMRGRRREIETENETARSKDEVLLALQAFHEGLKIRLATLNVLEEEDQAAEHADAVRSRSLDVYPRSRC